MRVTNQMKIGDIRDDESGSLRINEGDGVDGNRSSRSRDHNRGRDNRLGCAVEMSAPDGEEGIKLWDELNAAPGAAFKFAAPLKFRYKYQFMIRVPRTTYHF